MLKNGIIFFLNAINDIIAGLGENSGLLKDLAEWNGSIYDYVQVINANVVKPMAYVLLAIFFLMELYNATQRSTMNGGGNAYTTQQIFFCFVKLILCQAAFDFSFALTSAIYKFFFTLTLKISEYVSGGAGVSGLDVAALSETIESGFGMQITVWACLVLAYVIIQLLSVFITVIIASRFIELYVYLAIAPIPFATFCYAEARSIGVNFLKSFAAVCLQGALLYLVLGFYPVLFMGFVQSADILGAAWGLVTTTFVIALAVFLCGKWSKSIMHAS